MPTFLHVGCGQNRKARTTKGFNTEAWTELRLDIDPGCQPDIIGTMTDMNAVASGSVDALYSSHNIEHLYPHEVPIALAEFKRVLKPDGFVVITCPDLKSIAALVADDKLLEPAYQSAAGPISPIDMLYGLRSSMARGNHFMAHKGGFTATSLRSALAQAAFRKVALLQRPQHFELWAVATLADLDDAAIRGLMADHMPVVFTDVKA